MTETAESTDLIAMTNGIHTVEVVRSAFDGVWSQRGWLQAHPDEPMTERVLGLPAAKDGKSETHEELAQLVKDRRDQETADENAQAEDIKAALAITGIKTVDDTEAAPATPEAAPITADPNAANAKTPPAGNPVSTVKPGGDVTVSRDSSQTTPTT